MPTQEDFDPDHMHELAIEILDALNGKKPMEIYMALIYASTVFLYDFANHVDFEAKAKDFYKGMLKCKKDCASSFSQTKMN